GIRDDLVTGVQTCALPISSTDAAHRLPHKETAVPKGLTVVLNQPGKPLELETLPTPEVEPGGILIRNTAAAICGSDLHYWRNDGNYQGPDLRRVPGHEFTGVVHSLGQGIKTDSLQRPLKEGDRAAFPFFNPCNPCYWCLRGEHHARPSRPRALQRGPGRREGRLQDHVDRRPDPAPGEGAEVRSYRRDRHERADDPRGPGAAREGLDGRARGRRGRRGRGHRGRHRRGARH